jgi:hypothetical protein
LRTVLGLAASAQIGGKTSRRTAGDLKCAQSKAETFIRIVVGALKGTDFSHTIQMPYAEADVYGVTNKDGSWFVKLYIENGTLTITSCHFPEREITLENGKKVK